MVSAKSMIISTTDRRQIEKTISINSEPPRSVQDQDKSPEHKTRSRREYCSRVCFGDTLELDGNDAGLPLAGWSRFKQPTRLPRSARSVVRIPRAPEACKFMGAVAEGRGLTSDRSVGRHKTGGAVPGCIEPCSRMPSPLCAAKLV